MPFTTKELVRRHILEHHIGSEIIRDEPVQLVASDTIQLRNRQILANSETVKAREMNEPTEELSSFVSGDTVALGHSNLIPDTVVMARDSSLGIVYVENVDYSVDYAAGSVRRISSGAIPSDEFAIWYLYYRIYTRGVDYDISYQNGTIRRRSSGDIESGQWTLIDYTTEYGSIDDAAIENAITEANDQLLAFVDTAYRESTERALVTAETYLTVSIVCRIRAMESITRSAAATSSTDSGSWRAISEMYRKESFNILAPYAARTATFNPPSKA